MRLALKLGLSFVLVSTTAACVSSAARGADPVEAVTRELHSRYRETGAAFFARDPDRVMRLRHPDFHTITPDGNVSSRAQMYQRTRDFIGRVERFKALSEKILSLTLAGDTAHAIVEIGRASCRERG